MDGSVTAFNVYNARTGSLGVKPVSAAIPVIVAEEVIVNGPE
jgi:hypothetical protein